MTSKTKIESADLLNASLIEIRPISRFIDRKKLNELPHRHPFQEIIFIISGTGKHTIDGEVLNLTPNTIYVIGQGQVHEFLEGKHLVGFLLRYKESFLPSELTKFTSQYALLQMVSESNSLELSESEALDFKTGFEQLIKESKEDERIETNQIFHFLLLTLLSRLNHKIRNTREQSISKDNNEENVIYQKFMFLVEDNYKIHHHVSYYSDSLNLNPRKLGTLILDKSGKSPKQIISSRLITEAKRLIKFTNLSFKEIAFELGYDEPAYFSRLFKNKSGFSPKEFRLI